MGRMADARKKARRKRASRAEKSAMKREERASREPGTEGGAVATADDLEGYGIVTEPEEEAPAD